MITNPDTGTNVHEIAAGIYRINTPVVFPGGSGAFNFNQYLIADDEPLLFHTGPRRMFPLVSAAVGRILPLARLRHVAFSHFEADVAAMVSVDDVADRPARTLADGEVLKLGRHELRWFDTPHLPHGWDSGLMMDISTRTLFCGDLFTQGGRGETPLTEADILGPSEAFRAPMDYYSHSPDTPAMLERLAGQRPEVLACMHGSAWRGDGAALLRSLAGVLGRG
jgi:flavorubredoxin